MKEKESNTWRPQDADKELIKQQIRNRVRNTKLEDNAVLIPAKPTPTINDEESKVVAVYARVSTKSTEQVSSIENQTKYYSEKVEKTPNWTLQEIYSDEGKSGTSMRKRTEFQRMLKDAKDKKMDLILCASVSRFARNVSECIEQVDELRTQNPSHPVGVYFETENIYTLDESSQQSLDMHAMVADWESANKSRRMIISYDQRICMGQYPVADLLGYRHTKDGQLIVQEEEAKTVRFIFLSYNNGSSLEEIAQVLTEKKRPTLRGRTEWNAAMVQSIMMNERRWGDLHARKRVVISYKKGKTAKNNRIRDAAFVSGHHEAIVSPAIAKAAKMIMASGSHYDGGITEISIIKSGALKGFISISPYWAGINNDALLQVCTSVYSETELSALEHLANINSGQEHSRVLSMNLTGYQVPRGVVFMNKLTPSLTISNKHLKFNRAAYTKLGNCEYVEILYHPIMKTIAVKASNEFNPYSYKWGEYNQTNSKIIAHAFCAAIYEKLDWIKNYRFKFRGITRTRENSSIMVFYLDEPQILVDKKTKELYRNDNDPTSIQYIPYHNFEINSESDDTKADYYVNEICMPIELRKERDRMIDTIKKSDIEALSTVVPNPLIGEIPSKDELQAELDELLLSM